LTIFKDWGKIAAIPVSKDKHNQHSVTGKNLFARRLTTPEYNL